MVEEVGWNEVGEEIKVEEVGGGGGGGGRGGGRRGGVGGRRV